MRERNNRLEVGERAEGRKEEMCAEVREKKREEREKREERKEKKKRDIDLYRKIEVVT